jgi:hypothetical protein
VIADLILLLSTSFHIGQRRADESCHTRRQEHPTRHGFHKPSIPHLRQTTTLVMDTVVESGRGPAPSEKIRVAGPAIGKGRTGSVGRGRGWKVLRSRALGDGPHGERAARAAARAALTPMVALRPLAPRRSV